MRGANGCADRSRDGSARWRYWRLAYDLRYVQNRGQRNADLRCAANQQDEASCLGVAVFRCHPEARRRRGTTPTQVAARKLNSVITRLVRDPSLPFRMTALLRAPIVKHANTSWH